MIGGQKHLTLADVVQTSARVAAATARLEKIRLLADCLRACAPAEITIAVHYLSGSLPQGRIGVGAAILGALHHTAPAAEATLTLGDVDAAFSRLAHAVGPGAAGTRKNLLAALFARATPEQQRFLARLLSGELRQGALEGVMLDALAQASEVPSASVRRAVMITGNLATAAHAAFTEGAAGLARFTLQTLRPVQPMLAQTATDVHDALARLGTAAFEYKLDGARVQVHKRGTAVAVYTRALNDVSAAVPEIVASIRALPADELILDGETIALRPDGRPQPFQVTMRRFGRRVDVAAVRSELPLSVFFFDCLGLDHADLIDRPARERFAALEHAVPPELVMPRCITASADDAERFLKEALAHGHEGVMAKSLDAPYAAGGRGATWLKVKPVHTLDLVVLAAEWGNGRRRGWLSNLHLGARDPATGGFVMLGKTFKGMTDAMLIWQTERLRALAVAEEGFVVRVRPELVVEIAFNDIQVSAQYPGGFALRFARVKRYRTDKRAEEADTIETVRRLHRAPAGAV